LTFQEIVDLLTEKRVIRILGCSTRIFYKKMKDFPAPKSTEDWGAIQEISTRVGIQAEDLIILLEIAQTEKAALERVKQDEKEQKRSALSVRGGQSLARSRRTSY
jgi:hypothetical protein